MKVYRCHADGCPAAGADFEAADPVCPRCGADARKNPAALAEVAEVHYLTVDQAGPIATMIGNRRVACMPARAKLPRHATGERLAVSCPRCRASEVYRRHEADEVDQHVPLIEQRIAAEHGVTPQN